jgi:hypothetical protein
MLRERVLSGWGDVVVDLRLVLESKLSFSKCRGINVP